MSDRLIDLMSGNRGNLISSVSVVIVLILLRRLLIGTVSKTGDPETAFRARKTITYSTAAIGLIALSWIWFDAIDNLATYLGLVSAGIAIGLADLLKNVVGWIYIVVRRPFKIGDRIEIAEIKGDVIDIRPFRFSMMEVSGSFVAAEQSTGRLLHVPNGLVFTSPVANYTEAFAFVWHEIQVLLTFESDWRAGRVVLEKAITNAAAKHIEQTAAAIRHTALEYNIKMGAVTPRVYVTVRDSGVELTGRFLIDPRTRRIEDEAVWIDVLDGIAANDQIVLAYPTTRTIVNMAP